MLGSTVWLVRIHHGKQYYCGSREHVWVWKGHTFNDWKPACCSEVSRRGNHKTEVAEELTEASYWVGPRLGTEKCVITARLRKRGHATNRTSNRVVVTETSSSEGKRLISKGSDIDKGTYPQNLPTIATISAIATMRAIWGDAVRHSIRIFSMVTIASTAGLFWIISKWRSLDIS